MRRGDRGTARRIAPGKSTITGGLAFSGLGLVEVGIAGLSTSAAFIVGGLVAIAAAVGYFRGSG